MGNLLSAVTSLRLFLLKEKSMIYHHESIKVCNDGVKIGNVSNISKNCYIPKIFVVDEAWRKAAIVKIEY